MNDADRLPADELLARADACHDDDVDAAASLLRALPLGRLSPERRPRAAFLLNHVLGEKRGDWAFAQARIEALLEAAGPAAAAVLWRQAGAAAHHAGNAEACARHAHALAAATVPRPVARVN